MVVWVEVFVELGRPRVRCLFLLVYGVVFGGLGCVLWFSLWLFVSVLAFELVLAIGQVVDGFGSDGMVVVVCMGLRWGGGGVCGRNCFVGCCVLRVEWSSLMQLSYHCLTFNMHRLHAWMEGACGVVGLGLQFGSKFVHIVLAFVLEIEIRH